MGQVRVEKVQELIRQEVGKIILHDLKNPKIGFVTVTSVEMSSDLRHGKIFISLYGDEEEQKKTWLALLKSLPFIRREIGQRVHLRYTPELIFAKDTSEEYSEYIQKILREHQIEQNQITQEGEI